MLSLMSDIAGQCLVLLDLKDSTLFRNLRMLRMSTTEQNQKPLKSHLVQVGISLELVLTLAMLYVHTASKVTILSTTLEKSIHHAVTSKLKSASRTHMQ